MKKILVTALAVIGIGFVGTGLGARHRDVATMTMTGNCYATELTGGAACDLSNADLSGKRLHGSILTGANLVGANLSNTRLYHTNLTDASLVGANLDSAYFYSNSIVKGAHFGENTLSKVHFVKIEGNKSTEGSNKEFIQWLKDNGAILK